MTELSLLFWFLAMIVLPLLAWSLSDSWSHLRSKLWKTIQKPPWLLARVTSVEKKTHSPLPASLHSTPGTTPRVGVIMGGPLTWDIKIFVVVSPRLFFLPHSHCWGPRCHGASDNRAWNDVSWQETEWHSNGEQAHMPIWGLSFLGVQQALAKMELRCACIDML